MKYTHHLCKQCWRDTRRSPGYSRSHRSCSFSLLDPCTRNRWGHTWRITTTVRLHHYSFIVKPFMFSAAILTSDKISGHLHYLSLALPNNIPHCSWRRSATPRSKSPERTRYTLPFPFLNTGRTVTRLRIANNLENILEYSSKYSKML